MIKLILDKRGATEDDLINFQTYADQNSLAEVLNKKNNELAIHVVVFKEKSPRLPNAAVEAIKFALVTDEPMTFLKLWQYGEFDSIRKEWPDAPKEIFIGADPLACLSCGAVHTTAITPNCESHEPFDMDLVTIS